MVGTWFDDILMILLYVMPTKWCYVPYVFIVLDDEIKSVACCAGSGASVLGNCGADLYLTGEMSHHEVLQCTSAGSTVVLCEHSNTERGYLSVLKEDLESSLENVEIFVSKVDKDPLAIM